MLRSLVAAVQRCGLTQVLGRRPDMRLVLQIFLYLPLFLTFWYAHAELAIWISWLPGLFTTRILDLTGILAGTIICGGLSGAIFAAPLAALYRSAAVPIALSISALAAFFDLYNAQFNGRLPFTVVAMILDAVILVVALPLFVHFIKKLRPNNSSKPTPLRGAA